MVKQECFCKELHFAIRYLDKPSWEAKVKLNDYTQDAVEIRNYLLDKIREFEEEHRYQLFNDRVQHMVITISNFLHGARSQFDLFDNKINKDKVRATMYSIKDRFRRDIVRRASEIISPHEMRDAIGFGSVKDFGNSEGMKVNEYLLEDDQPQELPQHIVTLRAKKVKDTH